ncbi:MAG: hypothetical protein KJ060_08085 [Candidatus Hydrogenedentes bacterium]|nr:hypothetical protein [Candidatus Hydrogenedentota bacterium]
MHERLEALERPKAAAREKAGKSADGKAGGRGKKKPTSNLDKGFDKPQRTDVKVAEAVGMKKDTYRKVAQPEPDRGRGAIVLLPIVTFRNVTVLRKYYVDSRGGPW